MTERAASEERVNISALVQARLRRRYAAERRFRIYGMVAVAAALLFLVALFANIFHHGYTTFVRAEIKVEVFFDPQVIDPQGSRDSESLSRADYGALLKASVGRLFPEVSGRRDVRMLRGLVSAGADFDLRSMVLENPDHIGQTIAVWIPAADNVNQLLKGAIARDVPEANRPVSDKELAWIDALKGRGLIELKFNSRFFTSGDSREPELAGIWGAVMGSFYAMVVTFVIAFPLGVMTAVYLEEFARKSRWTDLVEVNINNLAAVPSIVFGLLGLAVFLNFFGLPRSAPLVGGIVLALMTLPTIIITGRVALKAVPPSIREAALGLGASRLQMVVHHVLPSAMPGILTGAIIGMAHALGETAPLLMIGMVAFVVDIPGGPLDPATALPVQIYIWSDHPERGFAENTSAAIIVLLAFLLLMNLVAVILRKRFERRW